MSIDASPLADPRAFALQVKAASDADLRGLMSGEQREAILSDIFAGMPDVFRADRAGSLHAIIHWHIGGREDGGADVYQVVIADGRCVVSASPQDTPRLTLRLSAVDFVKMVSGNANPRLLFMRGRMKARGDLALTNKFPSLFDIPKA